MLSIPPVMVDVDRHHGKALWSVGFLHGVHPWE
jgi:hypothetical protein